MQPVIALLPMDDRPVNYDYPRYLARAAGCEVYLPPREWLGNPWRDSQHTRLVDWLSQAAQSADALIIAIDTLAYGGLIPSRTSREAVEDVLERLTILRKIKTERPGLPVLASNVILRISRANSSEEEKDYWATYGSNMFRLSSLEHKIAVGEAEKEEISEAEQLHKSIPGEVIDDYLLGRKRNHTVNRTMLDWAAEGIFDYLLLPQDDTADFGWNIAEARALQAKIRADGLTERAITYPGADEIGCLLLASYCCRQAGFRPRIFPRYSSVNSPQVITAYEDRPIHELLKAHLAPLNGCLAASVEDSDLVLFFNAPCQKQGEGFYEWLAWRGIDNLKKELPESIVQMADWLAGDKYFQNTRREMESPQRSPEEFVRAMLSEMEAGRRVALADVAFVNGSDLVLGNLLLRHPEVAQLYAYSGWNTAGNTLGTALAQAMIRILAERSGNPAEQTQAHLEFLFLRFLDDYYYQARERTLSMIEDMPALGLPSSMERVQDSSHLAQLENLIRGRLTHSAGELETLFIRSGLVKQVNISNIYLPWQRAFEIGFDVKVTL